jgi:hypothetical protein
MYRRRTLSLRIAAVGVAAFMTTLSVPQITFAQQWQWREPQWRTDRDRLLQIEPGTFVTVRTMQSITSDRGDGRIFYGRVAEDVWDDYQRLAVPAIPRGSRVEMIVRTARDGDLILDLESVIAHGQRYAIRAEPERIESEGGRVSRNDDAAAFVGGGALLGTVIGAIAGGGKGAAIGAAAGAASGLGLALHGRSIRVPAGSLITFRLERGMTIGVNDNGFSQSRWHYHRYSSEPPYTFERR